MEFEHLNLWFSESGDSVSDLRPFSDHAPPAIFSPTQSEYGSMLEAMEMELLRGGHDHRGSTVRNEEEENEEEEEEVVEDGGRLEEGILGNTGCKNLVSERNRRRRLNQQLLALRSLVPCISKMDKRSILMDAATYLQSLHREIEQIKRERPTQEASQGSTTTSDMDLPSPDLIRPSDESSNTQHQILQIETDALDDRTFVMKVIFRQSGGAVGQVQRMIESLGFNISQSWTHPIDAHQMITTSFLNVKKQMHMTADLLKMEISKAAFKFGMEVDMDD